MNYSEMFALRTDGALIGRFVVAIEKAAVDVINEDPQTVSHAARMSWAKSAVLQGDKTQQYASAVIKMALQENGAFQAGGSSIADGDIQFIVNSYVAKLVAAGV